MKLVYTGRTVEFPPNQSKKLDAKLARLSKMLGRDKEAHVIVTQERFLHHAEITVNAMDHSLVAVGSDADLFTAVTAAVDKMEKQVAKLRTRWRDTKRHKTAPQRTPEQSLQRAAAAEPVEAAVRSPKQAKKSLKAAAAANNPRPRVVPFEQDGEMDHRMKPMTVDEALLEIDAKEDHLVFRDAKTERLHVLLRRKDGDFSLIET